MVRCDHRCDCFCHKNSDIPCVRCDCQKCYVCEGNVARESFERHINHCHHMAQASVVSSRSRPPLVDLVAVAA